MLKVKDILSAALEHTLHSTRTGYAHTSGLSFISDVFLSNDIRYQEQRSLFTFRHCQNHEAPCTPCNKSEWAMKV